MSGGDSVLTKLEVNMEGFRGVGEEESDLSHTSLLDESELGRTMTSWSCGGLIADCVLVKSEVDERGVWSVKDDEGVAKSDTLVQDVIEVSKSTDEHCDQLSDGDGALAKRAKTENGADTDVSCDKDWAPSDTSIEDDLAVVVSASEHRDRLPDDDTVLVERETDTGVDTNVSSDKDWAPSDTSIEDDLAVVVSASERRDRLPDDDTVLVERETDTVIDTNVPSDKDWAPDVDINVKVDVNPSFNRMNSPLSRTNDLRGGRRGNYHGTRNMPLCSANTSRSNHARSSLSNYQQARQYQNEQYVRHGKHDQYVSVMLPLHLICDNCPFIRHEPKSELYKGLLGRSPYESEKNESEVMTYTSRQRERSKWKMAESHASVIDTKFDYPEHYWYATQKSPRKRKFEQFSNADVMNVRNKTMLPTLTMPPELPLKVVTCRKLLILDLNGLLVDVVHESCSNGKEDTILGKKAVFKRPFCGEFLKFCFDRFAVAIWSSRKKKNVDDLVSYLMGDMKANLLFCWDQSRCTLTGYGTIEDKEKPLLLKEMKKVWYKEGPDLPWAKGVYSSSNTLLMDDSPHKALLNPPYTAVFPFPYRFSDENDCSLGPGGVIRTYLEGLTRAGDVQSYVRRKYNFGQRPITPGSSAWKHYEQVISKLER